MGQTGISVVMPIYNCEKYIGTALDSLLVQTFKEFEVICVDDGSTDSTPEILAGYAGRDKRIKVIHQHNQSCGAARNKGFEQVRGKYVIFLDGDDIFYPQMLEMLYEQIESKEADVCVCGAEYFDDNTGEILEQSKWTLNLKYCPKEVFSWRDNQDEFFRFTSSTVWNKMYRTDFVRQTGLKFQVLPNTEDKFFTSCALASAERITFVKRYLLRYRCNNQASLEGVFYKNPECFIEALEAVRDWLMSHGLYDHLRKSYEAHFEDSCGFRLKKLSQQLPQEEFDKIVERINDIMVDFGEKASETSGYTVNDFSPAISVIVPVYNVEKYIIQCVDSILRQTFKNMEIILIDDSSNDRSFDIIQEKYGKLPNVYIRKNPSNIGVSKTRNLGMNLARGKYVYFMDSDDLLLSNGLENLYNIAEKYNADIVHANEWYEPIKGEFESIEGLEIQFRHEIGYLPYLHRFPLRLADRIESATRDQKSAVMVWLNLYRRDFLLEKKLSFPSMRYEDNVFAFACHCMTDRIWVMPGAFYLYRQHEESFVHDVSSERLTEAVEAIFIGDRYVREISDRALEPVSDRLLNSARMSLFQNIWSKILKFYDGKGKVSPKIIHAVGKAMDNVFKDDSYLISTLLHFAAENSKQVEKYKVN